MNEQLKTLDVIQHITEHPEYTNVIIGKKEEMSPMMAINCLVELLQDNSINFHTTQWNIKETENKTLIIH